MRALLYRDKPKLEKLLLEHHDVRIRAADVSHLPQLEQLAKEYQQIKPFAYVRSLNLALSDEKQLQFAAIKLFDAYEHQLRAGLASLRQQMQFAAHPDTARAKRIYGLLAADFPDPSLDAFFAKPVAGTPANLGAFREELISIFSEQRNLSDRSVYERCERVRFILHALHHQPDRMSQTEAKAIATYVHSAAQALKLKLVEHASHARRAYPQKLGRGTVSLRTEELTHLHIADCISVEHELNTIIDAARSVPNPIVRYEQRLMIGMRCEKSCDDLARVLEKYGSVERFRFIPYLTLRTDELQAAQIMRAPRALFGDRQPIIYEARTYSVSPIRARSEGQQWNLDLVQAPKAWEKTRGSGATVSIIDTGVDYRHADLSARFGSITGVNYVSGNDPNDDNGHGTHVAGTVAGAVTGVAPDATLYAVKVLDMNGTGTEVDVLKGIEWSIAQHADVINMSLGSSGGSSAEEELIAVASKQGIAVCCAAGNDGDSSYNYPASYAPAVSVAAVNKQKAHASFSNHNDMVDISAPGVSIYSTWMGGGYDVLSGTSMATPHVAGASALLKSLHRDPEQTLKTTAERLGDATYFGAGLINLLEATK